MVYKVRRSAEVTRDLNLIEDHLIQAYLGFGDDIESATIRAALRIEGALTYIRSFSAYPHRGTEHPHISPGLRSVTSDRFVYYFAIDESLSEVSILAIYFGGIDHQSQILERLRH